MSEVIERTTVTTQPSRGAPQVAEDRAISLLVPFAEVKHLLASYPPPRRPNRNRPVNLPDPELRRELEAWEAASDEALQAMEDDLPE
jgi:hypothetical protein